MSIAWNRRRMALAAALSLTVAAVVWASREEQAAMPDALPKRAVTEPLAPAASIGGLGFARLETLRRADDAAPSVNAFAARSFYVPPPKPKMAAAPPPPPPTAPPLPFTYMGMLKEGGDPAVVFVVRGDQLYSLRGGEVIDGTYRVEAVGSDGVTFVYLPMNEKQTLRTREAS